MNLEEIKSTAAAAIMGPLVCVLVLWASCCKADYVLALHWPPKQCTPCAHMLPVEAQLRSEGYDIRTIDITKHPEYATAPGRGVPRYVYVVECGGKSYYTAALLVGEKTAGQLRRFCAIPVATTVGAWTRNAVAALFSPCPVLVW